MQRTIEQRYAIKFCVGLGHSGTETLGLIREVFKDESMSQTAVFKWHKLFKDGRESVDDEPRAGRPSTSRTDDNVQRVREVLNSDSRLSVRMIADRIGIDKMTVHTIITENLAMRKICAKLVPKALSYDQKQSRASACEDLLQRVEEDPDFLDNVITGGESWISEYDPETKRQSSESLTAASSRPKKARINKSRVKAMLIVFFDSKGVVHYEFVPEEQAVNGAFYLEVLKRLKGKVSRVRQSIAGNWKLHHDNTPSHTCSKKLCMELSCWPLFSGWH
ncbi:protein GVQW3-like isoform X2 [Hetaerina americana]|uniref:protein GVQW3-like isoform X2 n=1 Tax=Hetaerina americana TaxID=62018 RepID=UPI003A7F1303